MLQKLTYFSLAANYILGQDIPNVAHKDFLSQSYEDLLAEFEDPSTDFVETPGNFLVSDEDFDLFGLERGKKYETLDINDKNYDFSNVVCNYKNIQPSDDSGIIICPNEISIGTKGGTGTLVGDSCRLKCNRGYIADTVTSVACLPMKNIVSGVIIGGWDHRGNLSCSPKVTTDEPETVSTAEPTTEATTESTIQETTATTAFPTNPPFQTPKPQSGTKIGYFPSYVKAEDVPNGYADDKINRVAYTTDDPLLQLTNQEKMTGHHQILPVGECQVCTAQ